MKRLISFASDSSCVLDNYDVRSLPLHHDENAPKDAVPRQSFQAEHEVLFLTKNQCCSINFYLINFASCSECIFLTCFDGLIPEYHSHTQYQARAFRDFRHQNHALQLGCKEYPKDNPCLSDIVREHRYWRDSECQTKIESMKKERDRM